MFGKEAEEEFSTPFSFETTTVCQWRSETGVGHEIQDRAARAGALVFGPPDDEVEAGIPAGGRAHRTWLQGGVEGTAGEAPISEVPSGVAESQNLGVSRRIAVLLSPIPGTGDDLTVAGDNRTNRDLSALSG